MQLEYPQSLSSADHILESSNSGSIDATEEVQGHVPEYILSAIRNFKEGRQYFECGNFQTARKKFLCSIQNLAWERPNSSLDENERERFSVQDAQEIMERFFSSSYELIRTLCKSPVNVDLQNLCLPSASHIERITTSSGKDGEMSTTMKVFEEDPQFEAKFKRIVCAILCDNISALANCEEVMGRYTSARELHTTLVKLQKLLYGDEVIHGTISMRSLELFFDSLGCQLDEAMRTTLENPHNVSCPNSSSSDEAIASFFNNIYISNPESFDAAIDPSQNQMRNMDSSNCEDFDFFASFE